MLTRVDVLSENPFRLNIRDAKPTDSIIVDKIEGLTPPAVDLYMGEYVRDGGFYNGRRVGPRHPVITLTLNPNYRLGETMDGLREMVYRAFLDPHPGADEIQLLLHDDVLPLRVLAGHTEKIEGDPWSTENILQISMTCPNPYILGLSDSVLNADPIQGPGPTKQVTYPGSAETGFVAEVTITAPTSHLYLTANERPPTILEYPFKVDDRVVINSNPGSLRVQITRNSQTSDILYATTADSQWSYLRGRNNLIRAYGQPGSASDRPIVANVDRISYRATYWGI